MGRLPANERCLLCGLLLVSIALMSGCGSGPATSPAPVVEPGDATTSYTVQPGDTLHSIAWGLGLDVAEVAGRNGLNPPYTVSPGQILRLGTVASRGGIQREIPPEWLTLRDADSRIPLPGGEMNWSWPLVGKAVRRGDGVFIAGAEGAAIRAAEIGEVVYSGDGLKRYGNLVIIKHRQNYLSAYGHARNLLVRVGDRVLRGAPIAEAGVDRQESGVYFEIRRKVNPLDALTLLPAP